MLNDIKKLISYDNFLRIFWHRLKGMMAAICYGFPGKKMVMIGVTGTDGKTTTTHMIEHVLRVAGKKVAMISTVEFSIEGKRTPNLSKKTTLSPFKTQKFLRQCLEKGVDYVVIEASSHALHQSRLWGIPFSVAVITNITHEHLDYHGTMEKYAAAKKLLFRNVSENDGKSPSSRLKKIPHIKTLVLNTADQFYNDFRSLSCALKINYGIDNGDLQAADITLSKKGSTFAICRQNNSSHAQDEVIGVQLHIPGDFNIENALAASGAALACDLRLNQIKKGLDTFEGVSGRMERIQSPRGFEVIVDFALTPKALERLYSNLRQSHTGRIIGIIGSCGDRDKEKRPKMGEIVASYSDYVIVTDEEPYSEDPMVIMRAVLEGAQKVKQPGHNLELIDDRYKAIEKAVQMAQKDDLIVLTGMGSFQTRSMNDGPMKWDERDIVREIITN